MWEKLKFGDPEMIAKLQEDKPHIIRWEKHSCDCPHCNVGYEAFKCSVCGREEEEECDMFRWSTHNCRSCKTELLTVSELRDLKELKIKAYTLLPKELTWNKQKHD